MIYVPSRRVWNDTPPLHTGPRPILRLTLRRSDCSGVHYGCDDQTSGVKTHHSSTSILTPETQSLSHKTGVEVVLIRNVEYSDGTPDVLHYVTDRQRPCVARERLRLREGERGQKRDTATTHITESSETVP